VAGAAIEPATRLSHIGRRQRRLPANVGSFDSCWNARFVNAQTMNKSWQWVRSPAGTVGRALLTVVVIYSSAASAPHVTTIVATTAVAASEDDPEMNSGINGDVIIGPVRPHATFGVPNQEPYRATIEIVDSNGRLVASVQSGPHGKFRIGLPPGTYALRPQSSGLYPRAPPQTVVVEPKSFTQVRIEYDSGIR
jgi:hypothetical protein